MSQVPDVIAKKEMERREAEANDPQLKLLREQQERQLRDRLINNLIKQVKMQENHTTVGRESSGWGMAAQDRFTRGKNRYSSSQRAGFTKTKQQLTLEEQGLAEVKKKRDTFWDDY